MEKMLCQKHVILNGVTYFPKKGMKISLTPDLDIR
jgi:hypothetical protein